LEGEKKGGNAPNGKCYVETPRAIMKSRETERERDNEIDFRHMHPGKICIHHGKIERRKFLKKIKKLKGDGKSR